MTAGPLLVCLKWVSLRPEIDPLTGMSNADPRFSGAGRADWSALEWGLRLAVGEREVLVVTVAPAAADRLLRESLAVGAVRAMRIDNTDAQPASREVARQLAAVATRYGATTVCTGDHSLDRGSGSVPAFLAAELERPQALGLVSAERSGHDLLVERRLDRGRRERLIVRSPAVLSFEAGPELRRASLSATVSAVDVAIEVEPMVALGRTTASSPVVVGTGPYRPRTNVKPPPEGGTRDRLLSLSNSGSADVRARVFQGSPDEAAAVAHRQLVEWGYLESTENEPDTSTRR